MTKTPDIRCPWCGYPCKCTEFPWTGPGGKVPDACCKLIKEQSPAMASVRKIK